jgi:hypothetical protein
MLSGKRAFDGHAIADVLEAVLRSEPDWSVLPADTPRSIRSLLERCLLKDRRRRIADMSVVLYLLGDASRDSSTTPDHAVAAVRLQRTRVKTGVLGFAAGTLAAAVLAWSLFGTRATEALRPVHFEFVTPAAQPLSPNRVGLDNNRLRRFAGRHTHRVSRGRWAAGAPRAAPLERPPATTLAGHDRRLERRLFFS